MLIESTKVSRRNSPPGACVEFIMPDGGSIEVELKGEGYAALSDAEIVESAKATMKGVTSLDKEPLPDEAGVDQTLQMP